MRFIKPATRTLLIVTVLPAAIALVACNEKKSVNVMKPKQGASEADPEKDANDPSETPVTIETAKGSENPVDFASKTLEEKVIGTWKSTCLPGNYIETWTYTKEFLTVSQRQYLDPTQQECAPGSAIQEETTAYSYELQGAVDHLSDTYKANHTLEFVELTLLKQSEVAIYNQNKYEGHDDWVFLEPKKIPLSTLGKTFYTIFKITEQAINPADILTGKRLDEASRPSSINTIKVMERQ